MAVGGADGGGVEVQLQAFIAFAAFAAIAAAESASVLE